MVRLDDEQQAALRKFKQEALGVSPPSQVPRATRLAKTHVDRGILPVHEVAQIVGCQVQDVLFILRQLRYTKKTFISELTVAEAEAVREKWNAANSTPVRPTLPLEFVAAELEVDLPLLVLEAKRAGIPVRGAWDDFRLFEVEADHLRGVLTSRRAQLMQPAGPALGSVRSSAAATKPAPKRISTSATTGERPARIASEMTSKVIPAAAINLASKARLLPVTRTTTLPVTGGALIPPKPASIISIQRAQVARSKALEMDPDNRLIMGGSRVAPEAPPLVTSIGKGSSEVEALQQTLGGFAPKDHAVLFRELGAVLSLDEQIVRSLPANTTKTRITDSSLRSLMRLVCHGKFGLFAYHEVSNALRSAARKNCRTATPSTITKALANFRPMHTGVLTDLGKSRFMFWHVEGNGSKLATVTFAAMTDWVFGIERGQYVPLRGRVISVARGAQLHNADREDAQFMAEAALKLRKGIHIRRTAAVDRAPRGRNYIDNRAAQAQRNLTYMPHSDWLIPVVIEDGFVTGGLREGFFSNYGGKAAHAVRGFVRRAPGSSVNDPKTVHVSAHTRGGYDVGDITFMPTVTILRDR